MPDISALYEHSLTHKRPAKTHTGKGGRTETPPLELGTVMGRVNSASAKDLMIAQQRQAEVKWVIYLTPGVDVRINDIFIYEGRTLIVTVADAQTPSIPIYQKVFTRETQRG